jgi:hypothetical protein
MEFGIRLYRIEQLATRVNEMNKSAFKWSSKVVSGTQSPRHLPEVNRKREVNPLHFLRTGNRERAGHMTATHEEDVQPFRVIGGQ